MPNVVLVVLRASPYLHGAIIAQSYAIIAQSYAIIAQFYAIIAQSCAWDRAIIAMGRGRGWCTGAVLIYKLCAAS